MSCNSLQLLELLVFFYLRKLNNNYINRDSRKITPDDTLKFSRKFLVSVVK